MNVSELVIFSRSLREDMQKDPGGFGDVVEALDRITLRIIELFGGEPSTARIQITVVHPWSGARLPRSKWRVALSHDEAIFSPFSQTTSFDELDEAERYARAVSAFYAVYGHVVTIEHEVPT